MASRAMGVAAWAIWIAVAAAIPLHTPRTLTVKSSYSAPWKDVERVEYVKLEVLCTASGPEEAEPEHEVGVAGPGAESRAGPGRETSGTEAERFDSPASRSSHASSATWVCRSSRSRSSPWGTNRGFST